jgi:hypothetical protein
MMIIHFQIMRLTSQYYETLTDTTPGDMALCRRGSEHSTNIVPPQWLTMQAEQVEDLNCLALLELAVTLHTPKKHAKTPGTLWSAHWMEQCWWQHARSETQTNLLATQLNTGKHSIMWHMSEHEWSKSHAHNFQPLIMGVLHRDRWLQTLRMGVLHWHRQAIQKMNSVQ